MQAGGWLIQVLRQRTEVPLDMVGVKGFQHPHGLGHGMQGTGHGSQARAFPPMPERGIARGEWEAQTSSVTLYQIARQWSRGP